MLFFDLSNCLLVFLAFWEIPSFLSGFLGDSFLSFVLSDFLSDFLADSFLSFCLSGRLIPSFFFWLSGRFLPFFLSGFLGDSFLSFFLALP